MAKISDAEFEELPAGWLTKNLYRGVRVTTCEQVLELAKAGKAIWVSHWRRTSPAAFLVNWQVRELVNFLSKYELFTVIKKNTCPS